MLHARRWHPVGWRRAETGRSLADCWPTLTPQHLWSNRREHRWSKGTNLSRLLKPLPNLSTTYETRMAEAGLTRMTSKSSKPRSSYFSHLEAISGLITAPHRTCCQRSVGAGSRRADTQSRYLRLSWNSIWDRRSEGWTLPKGLSTILTILSRETPSTPMV